MLANVKRATGSAVTAQHGDRLRADVAVTLRSMLKRLGAFLCVDELDAREGRRIVRLVAAIEAAKHVQRRD
jgi:hypothetical protein